MEAPGPQPWSSCQGLRQAWGHFHYGFCVPWGRAGSEPSDVPSLPQTHSFWDVMSGMRQRRDGVRARAGYIICGAQCKMKIWRPGSKGRKECHEMY